MSTTTSYGTWTTRVEQYSAGVGEYVADAFGSESSDGYDLDEIVREFRAAVNRALPARFSLIGNEFIGPVVLVPGEFDGFPQDEDCRLDFKEIVERIDFWGIVERSARR
jgi:hypothetical protein